MNRAQAAAAAREVNRKVVLVLSFKSLIMR
jgi:hypothetical protein